MDSPLVLNKELKRKYRIVCKNGQQKWVEETSKGIFDGAGNLVEIEGCIKESGVYEFEGSKTAQKDVLRREKLLSFSHSLAKIGYWAIYPETQKVEWSDGIYEILEIDKATQKPSLRFYFTMIHPSDKERYQEHILDLNRLNKAYSIEYKILTPGGKLKYIIEHSPGDVSEQDNEEKFRFGVIQDITEMRRSQEALAESERHFKAITESSPITIAEIDNDFIIKYSNNEERLPGKKSIFNFVSHEYHVDLAEKMKAVFDTGIVGHLKLKSLSKDEKRQWLQVTIGAVKDNLDKVSSLILLAADITQQKKHEEDREKLIKEINHKYNDLMQFNYIVSHNLRAPVANILGMGYLLDIEMEAEEKKQIYDYIIQSAQAIDNVILDLNQVLSSRSPLNEKIETCYLTDIVETVKGNLKKAVFDSKADIRVVVNAASNEINSIKSYLQSVIYNLTSNSIKFKSPERTPVVTISAVKEGNVTTIKIEDNGIGFNSKAHESQVFGLYKRFHTHIEGKGLGLHMTKIQVEALGGSIDVESEVDKGTTFTIRLEQS